MIAFSRIAEQLGYLARVGESREIRVARSRSNEFSHRRREGYAPLGRRPKSERGNDPALRRRISGPCTRRIRLFAIRPFFCVRLQMARRVFEFRLCVPVARNAAGGNRADVLPEPGYRPFRRTKHVQPFAILLPASRTHNPQAWASPEFRAPAKFSWLFTIIKLLLTLLMCLWN